MTTQNDKPTSYKIVMPYVCLKCGAFHGETAPNGQENWYWRLILDGTVQIGRVGPFCCDEHSRAFRLGGVNDPQEPTFTLAQWQRMHFMKTQLLRRQRKEQKTLDRHVE